MSKNKVEKALKWIVKILEKHDIQYEISGGFSAYIYGAQRPIKDIDIDISEEKYRSMLPDIKNYIIYGPAPYKDKKWDLGMKILLDYEGQLIDIADACDVKMFDEKEQKWLISSSKFNTTQTKTVFGIDVQVIDPEDLIEYKKLLEGDHQLIDIKAVEKYLTTASTKARQ